MASIRIVVLFSLALTFPTALLANPPVLVMQTGHTDIINDAAYLDSNRLVTASADSTLRVWARRSGKELAQVHAGGRLVALAVSSDGRYVATGHVDGNNGRARLYRVDHWSDFTDLGSHGFYPTRMYFLSGDNRVLLADNLAVRITDLSGNEVGRYDTNAQICSLALAPDKRTVAIGLLSGVVALQSLDSGIVKALPMAWSDVGQPAVPTCDTSLGGPAVTALGFVGGGSTLVAGNLAHRIAAWDIQSTKLRWVSALPGGGQVRDISFNPDRGSLFVASSSGNVFELDSQTRDVVRTLRTQHGQADRFVVDPRGREAISAGHDGSAASWDLARGEPTVRFTGRVGQVRAADFSPDGRYLAIASIGRTGGVSVWDLDAGKRIQVPMIPSGFARAVGFSTATDGVLGVQGRDAVLVSPVTGQIRRFSQPYQYLADVAVSQDGKLLAIAAYQSADESRIKVYSTSTGQVIAEFDSAEVQREAVAFSVAISPDGQYVAGGLRNDNRFHDNVAVVWRLADGVRAAEFHGMMSQVSSVAFSSDSRTLLTASHQRASLLPIEPGAPPQLQLEHPDLVLSAAMHPDGRIATGGIDGVLRLFDKKGVPTHELHGHDGPINTVRFSPDGSLIVTASVDGFARLWDTATGRQLVRMVALPDGQWAVLDGDGRYDAANAGDLDDLHWVIDNEPVALAQLKARYYEPGLLARMSGFDSSTVRSVTPIEGANPALFPDVEVLQHPTYDNPMIRFRLVNRGGGFGPTGLLVNGREVVQNALPPEVDQSARDLLLEVDLGEARQLMTAGANVVEVKARNRSGSVASRGLDVTWEDTAPAIAQAKIPDLWALVVGVSDYAGDASMDLRYPVSDAMFFGQSLEILAGSLFEPNHVHVTYLHDQGRQATRENILGELERIAAIASADDVFLLFLAGHGITSQGASSEYLYLTSNATSLAAVSDSDTISSSVIAGSLAKIPALKQLLILDTCASGQLISDRVTGRSGASDRDRTLALDTLKEKVGTFILAGSAPDAKSYESSILQRGLLTHSLLRGLSTGEGLVGDDVDVFNWFSFAAEQVPRLAEQHHVRQFPELHPPVRFQTYSIGRLPPNQRANLPKQKLKPVVRRSIFLAKGGLTDVLDLTGAVNRELQRRSRSFDCPFIFSDRDDAAGTVALSGIYTQMDDQIRLEFLLGEKIYVVEGSGEALDNFAALVVQTVASAILESPT